MATKQKANTESTNKKVTENVKVERNYSPSDLITCRSITQGALIMPGKSGITYTWSGYGDYASVEYQDLHAWKSRRSNMIYKPHIVIEDDELLQNKLWKDVNSIYENMYDISDINEVLNAQPNKFKSILLKSPSGLKKAIAVEVATRLENGTFDSIKKLKIVDEVCGTELSKLQ